MSNRILALFSLLFIISSCHYRAQPEAYPFEEEIQNFEARDKQNPLATGAILFIGSSSIRMWETVEEDMSPLTVINRGFGGSQAHQVIHYINRIVFPYQPKAIVFYEGDNDIASGKTPLLFLEDCQNFVELVHKRLPETLIFFLSVKPSFARIEFESQRKLANELLQTYCDRNELLEFIDVSKKMFNEGGHLRKDIFMSDQLHLNAKGYELWTEVIRPHLLSFPNLNPKE